MKTALLHYWLTCMRGGERVLSELCHLFPEAELYTHACLPEKIDPAITRHRIHESLIASLPLGRRYCRYYLPLMPFAQSRWDLSSYDLIISSESGPVKGIRKPSHARHICYCHTPMRYLWDMRDLYYRTSGICGKTAMKLFGGYLRNYDLHSAECVDDFIANSAFVAQRIERIYHRPSTVIYPPADVEFFSQATVIPRTHYLFVGQLVCYKRPDLVVRAFAQLPQERLIVVGDGPLRKRLQQEASPNISFESTVSRERLRALYASSKALLFPGIEDFGIVPVEAQAAGCPVIGMNTGGTAETILDGQTGIQMRAQTTAALLQAIEQLSSLPIDITAMQKHVRQFSRQVFHQKFMEFIHNHT